MAVVLPTSAGDVVTTRFVTAWLTELRTRIGRAPAR
jgi:hypothetical protein